ncbi:MAG: L-erythro-3,5-diaminohexanoate dehydrogenase [Cyanobacteria bacterium RYN_339]|nr:L-erythro-3,5-diaminohexanoate dehydrogenase [Cyanobacteria bacterium RYN_339]
MESPFGVHRVLEPAGVLPYQAQRLDPLAPLHPHEARIAVEALNLDSASFLQLKQLVHGDLEAVKEQVMGIVAARGKMHNPVTGSGGVLIGNISEVGAARTDLVVGERVITLVSLTTTPLALDSLGDVDAASHQIQAKGTAVLFERSLYGKLPGDLDEKLVLSVLDVCGAPAQAHRLVKPGMRVVILGAGGRSGLLCTWIAAQQVGPEGQVVALEFSQAGLEKLKQVPGTVIIREANATDAVATHRIVGEATGGAYADLVINCVNMPGTEMASILAARSRGMVYFFSMATSFQAAALGAESVGQDVDLLMGNGYAEDHANYALDVVRANPGLAELLG